jgi:uncharacterized phiE125 gp8 family phage protein
MALKIVTPAAAVVSLPEAKKQVRAEYHTDDDAELESFVSVATAWIESWLGRAIGTQTWDYVLDAFPDGGIRLPLPPLQAVTGVYYVDDNGIEQTLETDQYEVDLFGDPGWVMPGDDGWPTTLDTINAVRIRFVAGYTTVPPQIKHAIRLLVAGYYENRESVAEKAPQEIPFGVESLLLPLRNWA